MDIIINGRKKEFFSSEIGYEDVLKLAFSDTDLSEHRMSITYSRSRNPPFRESGILSPNGEKTEVAEGMRFNATLTWNG